MKNIFAFKNINASTHRHINSGWDYSALKMFFSVTAILAAFHFSQASLSVTEVKSLRANEPLNIELDSKSPVPMKSSYCQQRHLNDQCPIDGLQKVFARNLGASDNYCRNDDDRVRRTMRTPVIEFD